MNQYNFFSSCRLAQEAATNDESKLLHHKLLTLHLSTAVLVICGGTGHTGRTHSEKCAWPAWPDGSVTVRLLDLMSIVLAVPVTYLTYSTWLPGKCAAIVIVLPGSSDEGAVGGGAGNKETGSWCHGHPSRYDNTTPHPNPPSDHSIEDKWKWTTPPCVFIIWRRHTVSSVCVGVAILWSVE